MTTFRCIDAVKSNAGRADAYSVPINDSGDTGKGRSGLLLRFGLRSTMAMVLPGLSIVVAPILVENAAVRVEQILRHEKPNQGNEDGHFHAAIMQRQRSK